MHPYVANLLHIETDGGKQLQPIELDST